MIKIYINEIKLILFSIVLLITGIYDAKTKTIPLPFPIAIVLIGLINIDIKKSITGLIVIGLFFAIVTIIAKGKIGGGDFKLMTALGFYFGIQKCIPIAIIGLVITLVAGIIKSVITKKKLNTISLPLAPGICVGGFFVSIINYIL